jgi:hypothetical protein
MKYKDILHFEPITDVIQFDKLDDKSYQKDLVRTFVYPDYFLETIIPEIVKNMQFGGQNQKGIQIIGNYGTGKSHLMSLIQLVAEFPEYLDDLTNDKAREILAPIAGKFKVYRFELQQTRSLWDIVRYQLQRFLDANDVDYHFKADSLKMYNEQLEEMMAAFEEKFPDKGFMFVIDEMLGFLRGRVAAGELDQDLSVLQALGQACARGRFCFMFGVQEMIYQTREFQFAAEMLRKVKDRYRDLTIRREDVAFVVKKRLLDKSDAQKALIREHLSKFTKYFSDMHANLGEYVDLFPVHPSYFENFQKIRLGQSQREVLKTLSRQFGKIKDDDIPNDNPGLITYDLYWEQMMGDASMMAEPDIKRVADTVKLVHDKIESNFEGARRKQIPLAKRIANACAIKILQAELPKKNGATADTLVNDLCCTFTLMEDHDFLVAQVTNTANLIIRATSGSFFEQKDNQEFCLRTEGGVNIDQQIQEFAEYNMAPIIKDKALYKFLVEMMGITSNPYRTGFEIYKHEIEWRSHKITRDGYIFFGGPNEKSTTQPKQHFYMIFMPVFQEEKKRRNQEPDELYFVMDTLSDDFKKHVCLYGAAFQLWNSATSNEKPIYRQKMEDLFRKAKNAFNACYLQETKVYYADQEGKTLQNFQLPSEGSSLMDIFNSVATNIFEDAFTEAMPHYPAFTTARQVITDDNLDRYIKGAIAKIIRPQESSQDGEAILAGLGCYHAGELNIDNSIYAQAILDKMDAREDQQVVNKAELLEPVANSNNELWRSTDYGIEAPFEFMVIATLVQLGFCEVKLGNGQELNASNIDILRSVAADEFFNFTSIKRPRGANLPLIREITKALCGRDLSNRLDRPETYSELVNAAKRLAQDTAEFIGRTLDRNGVTIAGVEIIPAMEAMSLSNRLSAFKGFCDKLATYTSEAKIKNLQYPMEQVQKFLESKQLMDQTRNKIALARRLDTQVSYLTQAKQYVPVHTDLATAIDAAVGGLANVLADVNDAQVQNYEQELAQVKQQYIDWYLSRYHSFCLNDIDNGLRIQLLNSREYIVCEKLQQLSILNTSLWSAWRSMFAKLKPANANVEQMLQTTPFANFNPQLDGGVQMKSIRELQTELGEIYAMWVQDIKDFLSSDDSHHALQLMDDEARRFANEIVSGFQTIDDANTAQSVIQFIGEISKGFEEVEITQEMLSQCFSRAMTIDETRARFDHLIFRATNGKDPSKVRIIFR